MAQHPIDMRIHPKNVDLKIKNRVAFSGRLQFNRRDVVFRWIIGRVRAWRVVEPDGGVMLSMSCYN